MNTIKTIIVDDEEDGRAAVAMALAKHAPEIEILEICASPEQGIEAIKRWRPDLVFLDINMPNLSGFDLLERLQPLTFETIFVSAHDKYGIKAIKFSALDYLLKPIDPDELKAAVAKMRSRLESAPDILAYQSLLDNLRFRYQGIKRIAVPGLDSVSFFDADDIVYIKAEGSYTLVFFTARKEELVSRHLKDFESMLSDCGFCRVHHSYLINLRHVQKYMKGEGGNVALSNGHVVDVSRRKKDEFLRLMNIR